MLTQPPPGAQPPRQTAARPGLMPVHAAARCTGPFSQYPAQVTLPVTGRLKLRGSLRHRDKRRWQGKTERSACVRSCRDERSGRGCVIYLTQAARIDFRPQQGSTCMDNAGQPHDERRGVNVNGNVRLQRRRILVVEDEAAVSLMLEDLLTAAGAIVVGPAADTATALALAKTEPIDCAVIDYALVGGTSLPVADALMDRSIPFLFASGYDAAGIDRRYARIPRLEKVYTSDELLRMVEHLMAGPPAGEPSQR
jgi:CheY-like chemotaxis protein